MDVIQLTRTALTLTKTETDMKFEDDLRVAIIQTTLNYKLAWKKGIHMSLIEEERAIREIQQHVSALLHDDNRKPDIVILPELSVPTGFLWRLRRMSIEMNAIVVAGMDYQCLPKKSRQVVNRAVVVIPNGWGRLKKSSHATIRYVGKTYGAKTELALLKKAHFTFRQFPEVWVFDAKRFGKFAIAICYDFLDLERVTLYKLKIQHLFVLAYNPDIVSFDHAAEALSRMVYCNVVVCNTGHFGRSAVLSPFYDPNKRLIYRHCGNGLSTSQIVKLPVRELVLAQTGDGTPKLFKSLPPGSVPLKISLSEKEEAIH
jgi:predicted amidohydrolase